MAQLQRRTSTPNSNTKQTVIGNPLSVRDGLEIMKTKFDDAALDPVTGETIFYSEGIEVNRCDTGGVTSLNALKKLNRMTHGMRF